MVTIKYEMHKLGLSVMVNVRVQISTGQYIYPISRSSCKRVGDFGAEGPTNRWIA